MRPQWADATYEAVAKAAATFTSRGDFATKASGAYVRARKAGWLDMVCEHMPRGRAANDTWTEPAVAVEAAKYQTRTAFFKANQVAYNKAAKHGWLEAACAHMTSVERPKKHWTRARCTAEALKHQTKAAFLKAASGAYYVAQKDGYLPEICVHMDPAPRCAYRDDLPAMLYYLRVEAANGPLYKIGITNRSCGQRYPRKDDFAKITVLRETSYATGLEARNAETLVLKTHAEHLYHGPAVLESGNTELFTCDVLGFDTAASDADPVAEWLRVHGADSTKLVGRLLTPDTPQVRESYLAAAATGCRLVQVHEDEWLARRPAIEHLLGGALGLHPKSGAREYAVCKPGADEAAAFLNAYHVQGAVKGSVIYGLCEVEGLGRLVAVMVLRVPYSRRGKAVDGAWELARFATSHTVVGAASRLWTAFKTEHQPKQVTTYADHRYFSGEVYKVLGFTQGPTWVSYDYLWRGERYHKSRFKKDCCWRKLGIAPDHRIERELTAELGAVRLVDAGRTAWHWTA